MSRTNMPTPLTSVLMAPAFSPGTHGSRTSTLPLDQSRGVCIRTRALLTANLLTVIHLPSAWNCMNQQRIGQTRESIQLRLPPQCFSASPLYVISLDSPPAEG